MRLASHGGSPTKLTSIFRGFLILILDSDFNFPFQNHQSCSQTIPFSFSPSSPFSPFPINLPEQPFTVDDTS
ncbi:hypothetical protein BDQ94DRAFT_146756 [Aspergillus welwitschiae]|uniref:Uncharacterized protein n=1 Tax=Aspergillus welwitschiae TaxID=1341132 RepID=A0A3F3PYA3_9EURO|nr:hypothetical protein BDQ94DRAFT_146756 [Aspergillus welwitschiae]RDH31827.1 hypothetical protein BDQ94DRAFT_146756 [Aspergillus welwitschiae]